MIIKNRDELIVAFKEISLIKAPVNLIWEAIKKPKTQKQLGFIFGAMIKEIKEYLFDKGHNVDDKSIKNDLYQITGNFEIAYSPITGNNTIYYKGLSDMTVNEAGEFIEKSISCIQDRFNDIKFSNGVLYSWVNRIKKEDIESIDTSRFNRADASYLSFIRKQPCLCCGVQNKSEAHHLRISGGVALKSEDYFAIPLCRIHHQELHDTGEFSFYKRINLNIDIKDFCIVNYNRWLNKGV